MENILIVSGSEKGSAFFTEVLSQNEYKEIVTVSSAGRAGRLLLERDFDLCIINTPLPDEFGDDFAVNIAKNAQAQVILVVKNEFYDRISEKVELSGVFTVAKPLNKNIFWSALKIANASYNRMLMLKKQNSELMQKIEDIRLVDRAKCLLISYLNISEQEAHRYIEKQAMDMRTTRRKIAEDILKTYSS